MVVMLVATVLIVVIVIVGGFRYWVVNAIKELLWYTTTNDNLGRLIFCYRYHSNDKEADGDFVGDCGHGDALVKMVKMVIVMVMVTAMVKIPMKLLNKWESGASWCTLMGCAVFQCPTGWKQCQCIITIITIVNFITIAMVMMFTMMMMVMLTRVTLMVMVAENPNEASEQMRI